MTPPNGWVAGMDGCRAGWIVVLFAPGGGDAVVRIAGTFGEIASMSERPAIIAVDMPIGLPERIGSGGRGPENAVRPLLGARQSSVFSVPSRAAIEATDYRAACEIAAATSDPPRKVSKQLFNIAPKIREVDECLRADATLATRAFEVHPEVAFWRLNGEQSLAEPKKVKGRCHPPGLALRRRLLMDAGLPPDAVNAAPPRGAAEDDLLDAFACAAIARRIHAGTATPFPANPQHDRYGLRMAIWA